MSEPKRLFIAQAEDSSNTLFLEEVDYPDCAQITIHDPETDTRKRMMISIADLAGLSDAYREWYVENRR